MEAINILYYKDFDFSGFSVRFPRVLELLRKGNFKALDLKKIPDAGVCRLKLDYANRLLLKFASNDSRRYVLLLEFIENHEYARSRFLRGKKLDENRLISVPESDYGKMHDSIPLAFVNKTNSQFFLLDKVLSFDDHQHELLAQKPPVIIVGSAGSGKTALTLEKIKSLKGKILYVTLSPYLVQSSKNLYYAGNYRQENQNVSFLSFREYLDTLHVIEGREMEFRIFEDWFLRHRKNSVIRDAHKLFEEFGGVIAGSSVECAYLSRSEYLSLGVKRSVFSGDEREEAYRFFEKYLVFLRENNFYDLNLVSYEWLKLCSPRFDFIVVDEVQDITNIQLYILIKSLKSPENFILCGDSNQVVHPNFFSWTSLKGLFYENSGGNIIRILQTNYRNSSRITDLANSLLKIKNTRFGSIDRESNYLIQTVSTISGEVNLLQTGERNINEINSVTKESARYAVIVMRNEDKRQARKWFNTPLLFSIHEVKGLEYENVILFNFVSGYSKEFFEICEGVSRNDLVNGGLDYSRARDKTDRSLDVYKFYINSFYVAISRSTRNLFILENDVKHPLFSLMGLQKVQNEIHLETQVSTKEEWKKEAIRLELQGKQEQAEEIRKTILGIGQPTPWEPLTAGNIDLLMEQALDPANFNKKAKDNLFDYALLYGQEYIMDQLAGLKYKRARNYREEHNSLFRKYYSMYQSDNHQAVLKEISMYGVDYRDVFNLSPLMAAAMSGAVQTVKMLVENGANCENTDNFGRNALQICLNQAMFNKNFRKGKFELLYELLSPVSMKIRVNGRQFNLNRGQMEFFLLNFLIANQSIILSGKDFNEQEGVCIDDFLEIINDFPGNILLESRKVRAYLSAHFSRNEATREASDSFKLYLRVGRGHYVLNPVLEVCVNETWFNVNDMMSSEKIAKGTERMKLNRRKKEFEEMKRLNPDRNAFYTGLIQELNSRISEIGIQ